MRASQRAARRALLAAGAGLGALALAAPGRLLAQAATPAPVPAEPGALDRVRARGRLTVALYEANPPFSSAGQGIDFELARALARSLGVAFSALPFPAGESMGDDLRNMVWRGHYLGYGPADVMLHVPVDGPLMAANPRVRIFGPYYREQVAWARDRARLAEGGALAALAALPGGRIAVPGQSLAGWLLIGAEGGRYRELLSTTWRDGTESARALARGEVAAAAGHWSELESVLGRDERFAIEVLPLPQAQRGWVVGCAVRREAEDLARALQGALDELARSGELRELFVRGGVRWRMT
jgi:ABC-type amino acid transport substrate-binding protein